MATRRQDLEKAPFAVPGYLQNVVMPALSRAERVGTLYYTDVQTDLTADTSRTLGSAPAAKALASAYTTWDMSGVSSGYENIGRMQIDDSVKREFGGLVPAELVGARVAKRMVSHQIETAVAAHVLNGSGTVRWDILNDMLGTIERAATRVRDYAEGRVAFVTSATIFSRVKRYAEIIARFGLTGVLPASIKDVRGLSAAQLAAALNVDEVLIGRDTEWYTASATYQDRGAVMVLPEPGVDPIETVQFGRTVTCPVGDQGDMDVFLCESYRDDNLLADIVQARGFAITKLLNPEALVIISGMDALNTVSTSTTT